MAETSPFTMMIGWNNGKEGWEFPVLPDEINIKRDGSGKEYNIVGTGPISTIEKPGLAEISFKSFFPGHNYPFNQKISHWKKYDPVLDRSESLNTIFNVLRGIDWKTKVPDPNAYVNDINRWMHSGYPVRFIYVGSNSQDDSAKISLPMSIESFERWEEAGSPGDIFYSLKLKEYVFHYPQKVKAVKTADGKTKLLKGSSTRSDDRVPPKTYTLKRGDTLIKVAGMQLGDSARWRDIQKLNEITDAELKRLPIGKVLKLPERR
ncbi:LysM peptidoglycan-binding domain-containing protein [Paenibacillus sp. ATY16]|uniref:LysM peptidoglycan-binding domain-containing protein n=1 Tax=Paenibacillus sp. ATY16 TaxID=1759312 RepID=UPI00200C8511|nr:LysM peptidoglycan-binding domain-containing protein [Paenibacillus sp. ATY16]MCK9862030.1 LysM peptidoglycan-binding domain-containing protein [Paenibacillus sp. ATY16]